MTKPNPTGNPGELRERIATIQRYTVELQGSTYHGELLCETSTTDGKYVLFSDVKSFVLTELRRMAEAVKKYQEENVSVVSHGGVGIAIDILDNYISDMEWK